MWPPLSAGGADEAVGGLIRPGPRVGALAGGEWAPAQLRHLVPPGDGSPLLHLLLLLVGVERV